MNLQIFKKEIDPLIIDYIDLKISELPQDNDLKFLKEQFKYIKSLTKDGKRIRPFIAYITYLSFGGKNNKKLIKDLIFLEIFHYFCLIHDDIMDNSEKRHGIKTINSKFGVSEAVLLGDYLFSWAWELLNEVEINSKQKRKIKIIFKEMIDDVFLGQALDLYSSKSKSVSNELILRKTKHKTAGYSFINPMQIGLILADKYNNTNIKLCRDLGTNLGLAFQIQDDLLDITSDFKGNKTPLKDITEGTHTIFTNFVFEHGTNQQKKVLSDNFGKEKINVEKVRKVFYDSGAIDHGQKQIEIYLEKSKRLSINHKYFLDLIQIIEGRKK